MTVYVVALLVVFVVVSVLSLITYDRGGRQ